MDSNFKNTCLNFATMIKKLLLQIGFLVVLVLVICLIFGLKTLHHHPQGNNDPKGNDGSPNVEYKNIDVVHYGAAGDGKTDDSQAFLKAWMAVCKATTPSAMLVPSSKTFLLNPVKFEGPCMSSNVGVKILGKVVAPTDVDDWKEFKVKNWLWFANVSGLDIHGNGQIDGQGAGWWNQKSNGRPTALAVYDCDNLRLSGLTHINSPKSHMHIVRCNHASISQLNILAPEDSPNTDGIDVAYSTDVKIQNCSIATGDDCIAISEGSSNIHITNIECGPGHGISIGSLGEDGATSAVEEVRVQDCHLKGTMYGARIKTWQGGSGYARKISFRGITLDQVRNPIIINQYYCNGKKDCKNETSAVEVSDVLYQGLRGTSTTKVAVKLSCSESIGCKNLAFEDIDIKSTDSDKTTQSSCSNAHGTSTNTVPTIDCLLP
ncbi:probable polygalacturonase At3g15720 [Cucurbita pepo subsp. pepo]|uniref:probable polygalacturonase At3g15720 n=1 Tax=Cucurbita pepo subsp. pepo TaxID=3664 RepID=UPI000C9D9D8A|nr:probable polygalacturonase At3g15720 [Cucurbita pepo subsp. pepo]